MKTTTVIPEGYEGKNFKEPVLKVPQFGVKLRQVKTKHLPFMFHIENASSVRFIK
jgi:hypothetical protein